jgi:hypothetical protein
LTYTEIKRTNGWLQQFKRSITHSSYMQNEGTHHALSRDQKIWGLEVTVTEVEAVAAGKMSVRAAMRWG